MLVLQGRERIGERAPLHASACRAWISMAMSCILSLVVELPLTWPLKFSSAAQLADWGWGVGGL